MVRRTRATNLYQDVTELELISRILGHSSTETTRIYAVPSVEMMRKAMESGKMSTDEKRLSMKEFAERIGYSREHVGRLVAKGKLKAHTTITGKKYFTEKDVEIFWNKDGE